MNGKAHRQYWWMRGICGLNRPSAKALGAKNKMPTQQLEQDKQYRNEETYASQRGRIRAINDNPSQEKPRVTY
jgi:hypothetical protein